MRYTIRNRQYAHLSIGPYRMNISGPFRLTLPWRLSGDGFVIADFHTHPEAIAHLDRLARLGKLRKEKPRYFGFTHQDDEAHNRAVPTNEPPPIRSCGHGDLHVSDFGWWHCRVCKQTGDDWISPADIPCTNTHNEG